MFLKVIRQISRSNGTQNYRFWLKCGVSRLFWNNECNKEYWLIGDRCRWHRVFCFANRYWITSMILTFGVNEFIVHSIELLWMEIDLMGVIIFLYHALANPYIGQHKLVDAIIIFIIYYAIHCKITKRSNLRVYHINKHLAQLDYSGNHGSQFNQIDAA